MTSQNSYPVIDSLSAQDAGARRDLSARTNPASDGAGAPPSNTAPANCSSNGEGPSGLILCAGVDSLYLSYRGRLLGDVARKLDRKKEAAASEEPGLDLLAQMAVAGHTFEVMPYGRGKFQYVLRDPSFDIQLSNRIKSRLPVAYCQVSSACLLSLGVEAATERLGRVLGELLETDGAPASVSRCDLYVDAVEPFDLDQLERGDWVCRARDINDYGTVSHRTGFVFGRGGDISARVYDKTVEIQRSGKDYMKTVWHEAGWQPGQQVIRTEFQLRGSVLKALGFGTLDRLIAEPGALWRYCTTDWLRLAVANPNDATRSRWETRPAWRMLSQWGFTGETSAARVNVPMSNVPDDEVIYSRHVSSVSSWMAKHNITDPELAAQDLFDRCANHHDSLMFVREEGFIDHVKRKAMHKAKGWNKRFGSTIERDDEAFRHAERRTYQRRKRNERDKSADEWDIDLSDLSEPSNPEDGES